LSLGGWCICFWALFLFFSFFFILIHSRELFRALVIFFSPFLVRVILYPWCDCIIISVFFFIFFIFPLRPWCHVDGYHFSSFLFLSSILPFSLAMTLSPFISCIIIMPRISPLPTNLLYITTGGNYINDGTIYAVNGIGEGGLGSGLVAQKLGFKLYHYSYSFFFSSVFPFFLYYYFTGLTWHPDLLPFSFCHVGVRVGREEGSLCSGGEVL